MESTLVGSGHSIGSSLLGSQLKKSLWVKEQFRGMGYYQSMKKQSENFALDEATDSFESFQSSLITLRSNIIENNNVLHNSIIVLALNQNGVFINVVVKSSLWNGKLRFLMNNGCQ